MRVIKATIVLLFSLSLALTGLTSANAASAQHKITPATRSDQMQAGWNTLDIAFTKDTALVNRLTQPTNKGGLDLDSVSYVGTSARPIATLPLISFRGKSVGGKTTNHVFVFTSSKTNGAIPAYQFKRLAAALPACKSETSTLCYWDAAKRGNGKGRSFVTLSQWETLHSAKR